MPKIAILGANNNNPSREPSKEVYLVMAEFERQYGQPTARADAHLYDQGLRAYMISVYNYMAAGVAITGVVAYALYSLAITGSDAGAVAQLPNGAYLTEFGRLLFVSPLKWVVMLAPLGMVFLISAKVHSMKVSTAQMTFWIFSALMGASLSSIFLVYTHGSIANIFFITAAAFGSLSLWGYTTKKDISGWGSFLIMGLVGIILASLVNIWLASSALQFAVSAIGVLVFAGLTAYDTQRIKEMYDVSDDGSVMGRKAIMGALSLYLDFINMFLMLLSLFGSRE